MPFKDIMTHSPVILRSDPSRTVIRPFSPDDPAAFARQDRPRPQRIIDRILSLEDEGFKEQLEVTRESLNERHRDTADILMRRFEEVKAQGVETCEVDLHHALLIGAYFSEEYSFEAAALFNPSIVVHPDQSGLEANRIRFVMSLRCIGEGHVSSVTFRTGTWEPGGDVEVDPPSYWAVAPRIEKSEQNGDDLIVTLHCGGSKEISETVIFPVTPTQKQGIEDVRLVQFTEVDGSSSYIGTYTAFNGMDVRGELLRTTDFSSFEMRSLVGKVAAGKGMALFPRRINGRYMMLGRQDNENLWLLSSDDLFRWDGGEKILTPKFAWEFIQIGNCGSPIEIDEGWLVITHGVGTVRNYCLGACLLDKDDPSKVLKRTARPLMRPNPKERDGYVPNVVYSCGALVHDRVLLLPYGVADSFATFATVPVDDLLAAME